MATHSSFLPGKFHGQRGLVGYSPWGCKESDMTEQLTHTHTYTHNLFYVGRLLLSSKHFIDTCMTETTLEKYKVLLNEFLLY